MSILQLPEEVLHRLWAALPDDGDKAAWRLCCRRFRDVVFKHGAVLRWQVPSGTSQALDLLPVLLSKFAAAGGSSITQLYLIGAQLSDAHCQALADAALSGHLEKLRVLELAEGRPHGVMKQMMLGLVFSQCRHLSTLDLSTAQRSCVCKMLRAIPQPCPPFEGLQVLRLHDGRFSTEQLCALRDALLQKLTALVELDLTAWGCDEEARPHFAEVITAALASGTLRKLNISFDSIQHDSLQVQAAQALSSHTCVLTRLEVRRLLSTSQLLVPVLAHNSQLQELAIGCVVTSSLVPGGNAAAVNDMQALMQTLGRLTCLKVLELESSEPYDPSSALRHLTCLTNLTIYGLEEEVLGPHNAVAMADALRGMPHLRSLSLVGYYFDRCSPDVSGDIPASVAGVVLQGCSAQLTSLVCNDITVEDDQPPQQLARLSAALMRLTSLQVLQVPDLAHTCAGTCAKDQYALAAAAVASVLPHLPALTELDVGHGYEAEELSSIFRSAALSIVFSACLVPCLSRLTLPAWLSDADRAHACRLLESSHPDIEITY